MNRELQLEALLAVTHADDAGGGAPPVIDLDKPTRRRRYDANGIALEDLDQVDDVVDDLVERHTDEQLVQVDDITEGDGGGMTPPAAPVTRPRRRDRHTPRPRLRHTPTRCASSPVQVMAAALLRWARIQLQTRGAK